MDGAPLRVTVTLTDCQHSGKDPRRNSQRKTILSFGAIISANIFRNRRNHTKDQHHHMYQDQEVDAEGEESGRPKNNKPRLRETRHRCDELLRTLLTVKLGRFLNRSHHQTTSWPSESRNRWLHTKDRVSHHLCEQVVFQSISGSFIM